MYLCMYLYFCNGGGLVFKIGGSVVILPTIVSAGCEFIGHRMNSPMRNREIVCGSRDARFVYCPKLYI